MDRRTVPVRLCDLPEEIRMTAARQACRVEPDPDERVAILLAALFPSRTVYWVAPKRGRSVAA